MSISVRDVDTLLQPPTTLLLWVSVLNMIRKYALKDYKCKSKECKRRRGMIVRMEKLILCQKVDWWANLPKKNFDWISRFCFPLQPQQDSLLITTQDLWRRFSLTLPRNFLVVSLKLSWYKVLSFLSNLFLFLHRYINFAQELHESRVNIGLCRPTTWYWEHTIFDGDDIALPVSSIIFEFFHACYHVIIFIFQY